MARPKDPKTSTVTDESGLPRRDFLRLSLGGAALIAGCGDDGLGGASETDGESSSTSGGTGETTGGETTTTTDATSGSSSSSSDTRMPMLPR